MVRVYAHLDAADEGFTLPVDIVDPIDAKFSQVKKCFLDYLASKGAAAPKYEDVCFYNDVKLPIADSSTVATFLDEHNDFFLRSLPDRDSALGANIRSKKDLSYYYAHEKRKLVSKPPPDAPREATVRGPPIPLRPQGQNMRQSPFGTDVLKYKTITAYSWEDTNKTIVKVSISFDGVGALGQDAVKCNFGVRQFEVLIHGATEQWRFACSKTHAEMDPAECSFAVRKDRVTLKLRKAKDEEVWFDLFKKRAIGDDDPP
jgi:hypothetical protein